MTANLMVDGLSNLIKIASTASSKDPGKVKPASTLKEQGLNYKKDIKGLFVPDWDRFGRVYESPFARSTKDLIDTTPIADSHKLIELFDYLKSLVVKRIRKSTEAKHQFLAALAHGSGVNIRGIEKYEGQKANQPEGRLYKAIADYSQNGKKQAFDIDFYAIKNRWQADAQVSIRNISFYPAPGTRRAKCDISPSRYIDQRDFGAFIKQMEEKLKKMPSVMKDLGLAYN